MSTRYVETEQARTMLLRYIEAQALPFSATTSRGGKRTNEQNRLQRQWLNDIAAQRAEMNAEEWRGYCKLHFGVPILRNENPEFRKTYDEVIRPLPYEAKVKVMMVPIDLPVTSQMTTKQKTAYLDAMHKHFTEQGVELTDPEALGLHAVAA